ncbi:hypothetical protein [Paludisphaera rhizosphaerae]|uniref:hypothetical protein n=1 Tax=Paludisphaera rhizosphaerae TaxID=2711216 RepID=UPI0013EC4025|nr:hypothetical protein [Paludisphaera rhizosphaerae]
MNRSLRLGGSIPPDLYPWLLKQLKNLADPEYLHPPNNKPAPARTRVAAMKLLGGMIGLGVKQQQVDINLYRAVGLDDDAVGSPDQEDGDALREALEFLRNVDKGTAGPG